MRTSVMLLKYVACVTLLCAAAPSYHAFAAPTELKELAGTALLKDVRISGEGEATRVEIIANKPLVYTFYKSSSPLKAVIDLSDTDPGSLAGVIEGNNADIKRITLRKNELAGGTLTRIEIELSRDADVKVLPDPADKDKLVAVIGGGRSALTAEITSDSQKTAQQATAPSSTTAPVEQADSKRSEAAENTATTLKDVVVSGDAIAIVLDGRPGEWKSFRLAKPERLVIDLFGIRKAPSSRIIPINSFGLETARIGVYPEKVRIVLDATDVFPNLTAAETANSLFMKVSPGPEPKQEQAKKVTPEPVAPIVSTPKEQEPPVKVAVAEPVKRQPAPEKKAEPTPETNLIKAEAPKAAGSVVHSISFRQIDGYSRIAVAVGGECTEEEPSRVQDGIILSLKNCELPKKLQRTIDTAAFPSVVQKITPYQVKGKSGVETRIRLKLQKAADSRISREGDVVNLDIANPEGQKETRKRPLPQPAEQAEPQPARQAVEEQEPKQDGVVSISRPNEKKYTGRRVTLEFADADIRKIFQLLAEVSNLNFLIGDDVSGTISIKLVNVPWDQALDVILDTKGLGMKRIGNIVQIKPMSKMQTLADEEVAAKKASEKVMELRTEIFDINYANVADVATQLGTVKTNRDGTSITQDARTNRLIVTDIAPALEKMRYLLKNIDLPEKQVMIEARIVEATTTFTRDLGVNWGFHYRDGSASILGVNTFDGGFGGQVASVPTSGTGFTPGAAAGISFGSLLTNIQLDLRLSAAATAGQIKIISSPRIATLNNKAAKITQGQQIAYANNTSTTQGASITFVEAALSLEVTPHINSDGTVIMKIKASNNTPGPGGTDNPPINKKEATTELLVRDGQTTVIGGIYVDSDTSGDTGVPFLMDIPLLGHLFKSSSKNKTKTELLIFITPRILS